jgi:hypothetical protein
MCFCIFHDGNYLKATDGHEQNEQNVREKLMAKREKVDKKSRVDVVVYSQA